MPWLPFRRNSGDLLSGLLAIEWTEHVTDNVFDVKVIDDNDCLYSMNSNLYIYIIVSVTQRTMLWRPRGLKRCHDGSVISTCLMTEIY